MVLITKTLNVLGRLAVFIQCTFVATTDNGIVSKNISIKKVKCETMPCFEKNNLMYENKIS